MLQSWRKGTRALARRYFSSLYLLRLLVGAELLYAEGMCAVLCVLVGTAAIPVGTGETNNSRHGEPWRRAAKGETEAGEIIGNTTGRKRQTGEYV